MIRWRLLLTPIGVLDFVNATENALGNRVSEYGWTEVLIFGIRVAKIQSTRPWESL